MKDGKKPSSESFRPYFHGDHFFVTVTDGNGMDWLIHHPNCVLGPFSHHRTMSTKIMSLMEGALEATLAQLREYKSEQKRACPNGEAEIIPLKRGDEK